MRERRKEEKGGRKEGRKGRQEQRKERKMESQTFSFAKIKARKRGQVRSQFRAKKVPFSVVFFSQGV